MGFDTIEINLVKCLFIVYAGQCLVDDPSRLLNHYKFFYKTLTPQLCIKYCMEKKFIFAGVQTGFQAFVVTLLHQPLK